MLMFSVHMNNEIVSIELMKNTEGNEAKFEVFKKLMDTDGNEGPPLRES